MLLSALMIVGSILGTVLLMMFLLMLHPRFGNKRLPHYHSPFSDRGKFVFPDDFLWGTSTAAQQIESQQNSDWSAFENRAYEEKKFEQVELGVAKPGHIHDLGCVSREVLRRKTDFDARFREDLGMMAGMGHNSYRFSFSWSRLFPTEETTEPSPEGIQFYTEMLDCLDELGMMPSATLFHFSSPVWLWEEKGGKRGWERDDAMVHFGRFVKAIASNFGGRISHWCTLNEPIVFLFNGYREGLFPPNEQRSGKFEHLAPLVVLMLEAHVVAAAILRQDADARGKTIEIGIAKHTRAFEALRKFSFLDRLMASFVERNFIWDVLNAFHTGVYQMSTTDFCQEIPGLKGSVDYIGINYYGRFYVKSNLFDVFEVEILPNDPNEPDELRSHLGWALYPHGFYKILKRVHELYKLPIYVLENGLDCPDVEDSLRQHFLVTHLREIWNAREYAKADVRGYFHWSLMDNFEWAEGFGPRFGLLHVDYENDFKRTPRASAKLYSEMIRENRISKTIWEKHSPKSSAKI